LSGKCKALSTNPSTGRKEGRKKGRKEGREVRGREGRREELDGSDK
jgi:hypothetical protein